MRALVASLHGLVIAVSEAVGSRESRLGSLQVM